MPEPRETRSVIQAIANVIEADVSISVSYGGEGVFRHVDTIDEDSATLIVFCVDGDPYEVRVRRVTEADVATDKDGVVPPNPVIIQNTDPRSTS